MVEFRREIKKTQAKFIIHNDEFIISENNVGQQSSYNLPQDFIDYALENGVLVEDASIDYSRKDSDGNAYRLSDDYKLELAPGVIWMIGDKYKEIDNFFITSQNEAKDGTKKFQLFRKVYNDLKNSKTADSKKFDWFVELYDKNLVGNSLLIEIDEVHGKLRLDVEMRAVKGSVDASAVEGESISNDVLSDEFDVRQIIYYGVPGTGKSFGISKKIAETYPEYEDENSECPYVFRTTLHPEYSYYDFVGSIVPVVKMNGITNEREISYDFSAGIFTKALCEAFKPENEGKKIFLVLEEMSRANVAAVFGDLFQLLDRNDSGKSEYKIKNDVIASEINKVAKVQLSNIYLPSNLYIYGSVNTSDQNVFVMDNAFKRRFEFEYVGTKPNKDKYGNLLNEYTFYLDIGEGVGAEVECYELNWNDFYQRFNEYVTKTLQLREDKQIGQFFIKFRYGKDKKKVEDYNYRQICNKLLQYMWSDIHKSSMAKAPLFVGVDNYEDAYSKLSDRKNIFCEEFIMKFKKMNKDKSISEGLDGKENN